MELRCPTPLRVGNQVHQADLPTPPGVRLHPLVDGRRRRLLLRNGLRLARGIAGMALRGKPDPGRIAELVITLARDMGGLWVRIVSFLSDHRFTLPDEFCQVLLTAGERTDGFPFEVVRRVVEEDLGRPLEEIFETFDQNPIAASFSSQTHKARLRVGRGMVAVKVQRPGISQTIVTDLRIVRGLVPLLCRLTRIPRKNWEDGLWRMESTIALELDYRLEATHMMRVGRRLRKHKVLVPWVYLEYSGKRVLTKQFVAGVTVAELVRAMKEDRGRAEQWLLENDIQPEKVGKHLFGSLMRQVLEEDMFDQDWNPNNTMLLKGNRLAIVDFWAMRAPEKTFQARLGTLLQAIAQREFRKAADYFILIGPPVPMTHDVSEVRRKIVHALRTFDVRGRAELLPYDEKTLIRAFGEMGRAMVADGSSPTLDFLEVDRAFRVLELSLRDLIPRANVVRMHEKFWEESDVRRLRDDVEPQIIAQESDGRRGSDRQRSRNPLASDSNSARNSSVVRRRYSARPVANLPSFWSLLFSLLTKGLLATAVLLLAAFGFRRFHGLAARSELDRPFRRASCSKGCPGRTHWKGSCCWFWYFTLLTESWKLKCRLGQKTLSRPDGSD